MPYGLHMLCFCGNTLGRAQGSSMCCAGTCIYFILLEIGSCYWVCRMQWGWHGVQVAGNTLFVADCSVCFEGSLVGGPGPHWCIVVSQVPCFPAGPEGEPRLSRKQSQPWLPRSCSLCPCAGDTQSVSSRLHAPQRP